MRLMRLPRSPMNSPERNRLAPKLPIRRRRGSKGTLRGGYRTGNAVRAAKMMMKDMRGPDYDPIRSPKVHKEHCIPKSSTLEQLVQILRDGPSTSTKHDVCQHIFKMAANVKENVAATKALKEATWRSIVVKILDPYADCESWDEQTWAKLAREIGPDTPDGRGLLRWCQQ